MQTLKPWLNDDYIHRASVGAEDTITLWFVDGGHQTYQIDDCTSGQLENTLKHLKKKGVQVIK